MALKQEFYLFFPGTTKEAMEFYKETFGGELSMQTRGEVDPQAPDDAKDSVIHARLEGGDVVLMASDDLGDIPKESARISVSLTGDDEAKMRKLFDALGEGGQVSQQLEKQFWGDIFGAVRDKFGISWMVDILAKKDD